MFAFLRRLFDGSPDRDRNGIPYMPVSVNMRLENYTRLDALARSLECHGDALVDLALREWLDNHEDDLRAGRVVLTSATEDRC